MKKKLIIIISFIIVIILTLIGILLKKNSYQELNNYLNNGSNLAFFYETESGEYEQGTSFASLSDIYSLNVSRSTCDNGLEGIEWDGKNKTLLLPTNKSNRCKLVFDINKRFTLLSYYPITERDAQITNMIKNGDYEDGEKNWSNSNASVTSAKFSHGKNSLQLNGGQLTAMSTQVLDEKAPTFNHSYYGRLKFLSNETFTSGDNRYEWYFGDFNETDDLVFARKVINVKDWTLMSNIATLRSTDYVSENWIIRNFQVNPTDVSYTDELMMIDLTAGYGEDIPTKEELDSELIYFDGTVDIKSINSKKDGVFTVSDLPEDVEIECSNGGNAQISGNTVTITGDSAQTTCYIKEKKMSMIEYLLQKNVGDGQLLQHTSDLSDSAGDDGYRYSGNQPNNYICFGKGSEAYNKGTPGETCDINNKYRIIGYVPVLLDDKKTTISLIKVIKAEYLSGNDFRTKDGSVSFYNMYKNLARIESVSADSIDGYYLGTSFSSLWDILTELNSEEYINETYGTWQGKIQQVSWNLQNASTYYPYDDYISEMKYENPVTGQIGLMYLYDYGFAASSNNWQTRLSAYNTANNRNQNWLYNSLYEWVISRPDSTSIYSYYISNRGIIDSSAVTNNAYGVRPVFYLKSDVNINDSDADGSRDNPFRIAI